MILYIKLTNVVSNLVNVTVRAAGWTPLGLRCQSDDSPTPKTENKPEGDNIKRTAYFTDIPVIQCYEFYLVFLIYPSLVFHLILRWDLKLRRN